MYINKKICVQYTVISALYVINMTLGAGIHMYINNL